MLKTRDFIAIALLSGAIAGVTPAYALAPGKVSPDYVADLVFKGCFAALNGSLDLADEATAPKMGMTLLTQNSEFIKHQSGEGALILDRADLLGSSPKQDLDLHYFAKARACKVNYFGIDYLDVKSLVSNRFAPLVPKTTSDSNDTFDEYLTEVSPQENLRILVTAPHPRSGRYGMQILAELVKKP